MPYDNWDEVPEVYAQNPEVFTLMLRRASAGHARIALLGDSQEDGRAGAGGVYIPRLNYEAFLRYGQPTKTLADHGAASYTGTPTPRWLGMNRIQDGAGKRVDTTKFLPNHSSYNCTDGATTRGVMSALQPEAPNIHSGAQLPTQEYVDPAKPWYIDLWCITDNGVGQGDEIEVYVKPTDLDTIDWFATTVQQFASTTLSLTDNGNEEIRGERFGPLDWDGKKNMQVRWRGDGGLNARCCAFRYVQAGAGAKGLAFDDFSQGGYRSSDFLANHGNAGPMLAAFGPWDALMLQFGANDGGAATDPAVYQANIEALIAAIRGASWLNDASLPVILVSDVYNDNHTTAERAVFDQYPSALQQICEADANCCHLNLRRIMEGKGLGADGDWATYLSDGTHYTEYGAREVAHFTFAALMEIDAQGENQLSNYYAKSDATGRGDGSSWEHAFTTLQAAYNAMQDGDTLYTDAPQDQPFPANTVTTRSNITTITNEGPNRRTWISFGRAGTWSLEADNIFSLPLASPPKYVTWDFRQDDIFGTVTGIDVSQGRPRQLIAHHKLNIQDCRAWYGFMRENPITPTTPDPGEWGYEVDTLYVRPPALNQTAAQVSELTRYVPGNENGITYLGDDVTLEGELWVILGADDTGNNGYSVQGQGARNRFSGVRTVAAGKHAVGHAGVAGDGCEIHDQLCIGHLGDASSQLASPYVWFSSTANITSAAGSGLHFIAHPHLDTAGVPIQTTYVPVLCNAHASGFTVTGIEVQGGFCLDFSDPLEAKHSISIAGQGKSASMNNVVLPTDYANPEQYPLILRNCQIWGRAAIPGAGASMTAGTGGRPLLDRQDHGDTAQDSILNVAGGSYFACLQACDWYVGGFTNTFTTTFEPGDHLIFDDCFVDVSGGVVTQTNQNDCFIKFASNSDVQFLNGTRVVSRAGGINCPIRANAATTWDSNFPGLDSDGSNSFGEHLPDLLRHSNSGVTPRHGRNWREIVANDATEAKWLRQGGLLASPYKQVAEDLGASMLWRCGDPVCELGSVHGYDTGLTYEAGVTAGLPDAFALFDGANSIDLGIGKVGAPLDGVAGITVSIVVVMKLAAATRQALFSTIINGTSNLFILEIRGDTTGEIRAAARSTGADGIQEATGLPPSPTGRWCLVATFDYATAEIHIYVDGFEIAKNLAPTWGSTTLNMGAPTALDVIGSQGHSARFLDNARIEGVSVFPRVLDADEAAALNLAANGDALIPSAMKAGATAGPDLKESLLTDPTLDGPRGGLDIKPGLREGLELAPSLVTDEGNLKPGLLERETPAHRRTW